MKTDFVYGRVDGKKGQIVKRAGEKDGSAVAYATDCFLSAFYTSKKKGMPRSTADADETRMKAKSERLFVK